MEVGAFQFTGTPSIQFGLGTSGKLVELLPHGTRRVLFVMGSFERTNAERWGQIVRELEGRGMSYECAHIRQEPDVAWVDEVTERMRGRGAAGVDAVVAIGGGSALDAGKAVSAMLCTEPGESILHYLEGQPDYRPHSGRKVYFVAVPTTSGTGSEMTKNAVISIPGGFKRSLRHDRFIPDLAIVDAELTISCPLPVKAASGMDALTQLIESYVSVKASALTDALTLSGIEAAAGSLLPLCTQTNAGTDPLLHERMAYASMLSGITLAHAGLGVVHGIAAPLGGQYPVPHGAICGTLLAEATKRNIEALRRMGGEHTAAATKALAKYAKVGALLTGSSETDHDECCDRLIDTLFDWTERLELPKLGAYGVGGNADTLDQIIAASDNKQSPVQLDRGSVREMILARV
jgi:alcohol dehydrogenase class IV